jgi:Domain of unknown function (DUF4399)
LRQPQLSQALHPAAARPSETLTTMIPHQPDHTSSASPPMDSTRGAAGSRARRHAAGSLCLGLAALFTVAACAKKEGAPADTSAMKAMAQAVTVTISSPAEGDTIHGDTVHIVLGASGIELAPAAEGRAGTAHHHLYLDTDLGTPDLPIPAGTPGIVHLGKAETTYAWANVAPGPHRIIAILADPSHVPLSPLVADTVHIVVVKP